MRGHATSALAVTLFVFLATAPSALTQPPSAGGLSLAKIEALLKLKTPDGAVAGEIGRRGLSFTPDAKALERLKALGAGPLTIGAVEALRPILEDARKQLPELLQRLYRSLDEGDLQRARPLLSPELAADVRKLDSICKPFTYRAHYVEGFVERPGRSVEARVRVLSRPLTETAYVLVLRAPAGVWQVQDVLPAPADWFAPLVTSAQDLGHRFVYALKAGRQDVVEEVVHGVDLALLFHGRCGEAVKGMGDVSRESGVGARDAKGLKGVATVSLQRGGDWHFFAEPVGTEPKIVRFETNLRGCDRPEEDPSAEARTLSRFGLVADAPAPAPTVATAPTAGLDSRTLTALQEEAQAALAGGDVQTAYRRWDEILEAGGTVTLPACREGSGFGRCVLGAFSINASELKFIDDAGTTPFAAKLAEVTRPEFETSKIALTKESVGRLKLHVGEKSQNFNYIPQGSSDCKRGKFYGCADGSRALAQQAAVARYLARTIERLKTSNSTSLSLPTGGAAAPSSEASPVVTGSHNAVLETMNFTMPVSKDALYFGPFAMGAGLVEASVTIDPPDQGLCLCVQGFGGSTLCSPESWDCSRKISGRRRVAVNVPKGSWRVLLSFTNEIPPQEFRGKLDVSYPPAQ